MNNFSSRDVNLSVRGVRLGALTRAELVAFKTKIEEEIRVLSKQAWSHSRDESREEKISQVQRINVALSMKRDENRKYAAKHARFDEDHLGFLHAFYRLTCDTIDEPTLVDIQARAGELARSKDDKAMKCSKCGDRA